MDDETREALERLDDFFDWTPPHERPDGRDYSEWRDAQGWWETACAEIARLRERMEALEGAVRFFTECELATVEYMEGLANPTKSQLERHRKIADRGLRVLRGFSLGRAVGTTPRVDRARRDHDRDGAE